MKTTSIKPIIYGAVVTALTISTTYAGERRDSAPIYRNILDSESENEQECLNYALDDAGNHEFVDAVKNKRKRDDNEDLNNSGTPIPYTKAQKLETNYQIMSTSDSDANEFPVDNLAITSPNNYSMNQNNQFQNNQFMPTVVTPNYLNASSFQGTFNPYPVQQLFTPVYISTPVYVYIVCIGDNEIKSTDTETDLCHNQLTSLPDSFGYLLALESLELQGNQLASLPSSFGYLLALESLGLDNNKLISLPDSFGNLGALKILHLHNNQLITLPYSFGNLGKVTDLRLHNNQLTSLPYSFGNLVALNELDLSSNKLTTLPDNFGELRALYKLYLNDNQLTTLPDSIGNLGALDELYLNDNQLTTLPDNFGKLRALDEVILKNNQLTTLPDSIGNLWKLGYLDLKNNQLTTLPDSIGNLWKLEYLNLTGNPLIGDEQQWAKILRNAELVAFRKFYKKRDILGMKTSGLLLLANQFDTKSFLADIPIEVINYIMLLHFKNCVD